MTVKGRESPYQARLGIQVFFGGFKGIPVFIEVSQETAKIRIPASSLPESNHVLQGAVQFLLLKVYFLVGYGHVFPKPICFFSSTSLRDRLHHEQSRVLPQEGLQ